MATSSLHSRFSHRIVHTHTRSLHIAAPPSFQQLARIHTHTASLLYPPLLSLPPFSLSLTHTRYIWLPSLPLRQIPVSWPTIAPPPPLNLISIWRARIVVCPLPLPLNHKSTSSRSESSQFNTSTEDHPGYFSLLLFLTSQAPHSFAYMQPFDYSKCYYSWTSTI